LYYYFLIDKFFFAVLGFFCVFSFPVLSAEKISPVEVAIAKMNHLPEKIPLSGSVTPRRNSDLSSEVDGLVSQVRVDDGDSVKTGDPLVVLENSIALLDSERAAAALNEAKETFKEAVRQRNEAEKLVEKRHVAETGYKALIANARIKKAIIKKLTAEYTRSTKIADQYTIRAPFDGIIGQVTTEIGEWIETGDALLELYDINSVRIQVPVPQHHFGLIHIGTQVLLKFDALPKNAIKAQVTKVIPISNPATRTFPVRIDIPNTLQKITPGMSVKVIFLTSSDNEPVLMLPQDAIVKSQDGTQQIWLVRKENNKLHTTPVQVKTGRRHQELIEIIAGKVVSGDKVVVRGNEILKPNQQVRLIRPVDG